MAAFGWKQKTSVAQWLYSEPWAFDFFQAVRLLEMMRHGEAPVGEAPEPAAEPVRFRSDVHLAFAASEIQNLKVVNGQPELSVNFFGLTGPQGPLPLPDTERVMERLWYKDRGFRDFLDIFNHRLLTIFYRIRKLHRPALTADGPDEVPISNWLFSLFGLGIPQLRRRMQAPDRALLYYAGLLAQHPRSGSGLERVLSDYYRLPVRVKHFSGMWRNLGQDQWTRIGKTGQNQVLGSSAVAGTRIWDQQGQFDVILGPMDLSRFTDLLPDSKGHTELSELVRFYAGTQFEWCFRLVLLAKDVPPSKLGKAKLGWTSFLKTKASTADDDQVRLRGRIDADN